MIDFNKFYNHISSDDIIYHYTKASTAIDYILFNKLLKLTPRNNSFDPVEIFPSYSSVSNSWSGSKNDWDKLHSIYATDIKEIEEIIQNRIDKYVQVCFCKNKILDEDFSNLSSQQESFGFTKPRMWDQYADKYTGVCIAFSKSKLLEKNKNLDLIKEGQTDVSYCTYSKLGLKREHIFLNTLDELGRNKFEKFFIESLDNELFLKHIDYQDENEYKICTLFDKKESYPIKHKNHFRYYMCLDIENCIEAIFMSSYANSNQKKSLRGYSKDLKVPLLQIKWGNTGIEIEDYESFMNIIETVQNANKG